MTPEIQYYLDKLQEEAAEVIQAVSKIRRFGPANKKSENHPTNMQEFVGEVEDFLALLAALESTNCIDLTLSQNNIAYKLKQIYRG